MESTEAFRQGYLQDSLTALEKALDYLNCSALLSENPKSYVAQRRALKAAIRRAKLMTVGNQNGKA